MWIVYIDPCRRRISVPHGTHSTDYPSIFLYWIVFLLLLKFLCVAFFAPARWNSPNSLQLCYTMGTLSTRALKRHGTVHHSSFSSNSQSSRISLTQFIFGPTWEQQPASTHHYSPWHWRFINTGLCSSNAKTKKTTFRWRNTIVESSKATKFIQGLVFVCVCYDTFPLRGVEQSPGAEYSKRDLTGGCFTSLLKTDSHRRRFPVDYS